VDGTTGLTDQLSSLPGEEPEDGAAGKSEGASRGETHQSTDFRKIADPGELEKAHAAAELLARLMRTRLTRRENARHKGRRIDLRATIRRNIGVGGVPVDLLHPAVRRCAQAARCIGFYADVHAVHPFYSYVLDSFHEAEALFSIPGSLIFHPP
jgi:uncharacterized protein with von Willebrand factor type A (vWA) domain